MKIVFTSDWHMDRYTSGVKRFDDVVRSVDVSVKAAIEMKADYYIMLGDLCDPCKRESYRAVAHAIKIDRELRSADVEPFWIAGNHDVIEDGSGDNVMLPMNAAGCIVYDRPTVLQSAYGSDEYIVLLPFAPSSHSYDLVEFIKGVPEMKLAGKKMTEKSSVVVAGHLSIDGAEPGSETKDMPRGRDVFWPTAVIKECMPQAVMVGGHYHKQQIVDGIYVVGAVERLTHGEEENRPSYLVVEVGDG